MCFHFRPEFSTGRREGEFCAKRGSRLLSRTDLFLTTGMG